MRCQSMALYTFLQLGEFTHNLHMGMFLAGETKLLYKDEQGKYPNICIVTQAHEQTLDPGAVRQHCYLLCQPIKLLHE